jgi:UDP-N-acetyl-D-mannosaminuronate dehydrogenase
MWWGTGVERYGLAGNFEESRRFVVGTGYLGATHAVCMAELDFQVLGVDIDAGKVARLAGHHQLPTANRRTALPA